MRKELFIGKEVRIVRTNEVVAIKDILEENPTKTLFSNGKVFHLFAAFKNGAIEFLDKELAKELTLEIKATEAKEAQKEEEDELARQKATEAAVARAAKIDEFLAKNPKKGPRTRRVIDPLARVDEKNIAYKATYCDGNGDWFKAPCSRACRQINCEEADRSFFCRTDSICKQVVEGNEPESAIQERYQSGFLCYECNLLNGFIIYAGRTNGTNLPKNWNLEDDRLVVLTTRKYDVPEDERIIFGVMLVDKSHKQEGNNEAYATSYPDCRLALTEDEAKNLKFWDYAPRVGENKNRAVWGCGLWRYLTDQVSANILKAVVEIIDKRNNPAQSAYAHAFLDKFLEKI